MLLLLLSGLIYRLEEFRKGGSILRVNLRRCCELELEMGGAMIGDKSVGKQIFFGWGPLK